MERLTIDEIIEHCDRKTRMYEKSCDIKFLETTTMNNPVKEYWEHKQVAEYLRKLKAYEDLDEQGRLVKLPCKVGARLYWIDDEDDYGHKEMCIKQYSESEKVTGFSLGEDGEVFVFIGYDGSDPSIVGERYALLTRELAEAKLKELRGGENE